MLTKIRKGTDNLFVKIILGIIALSFVGVGGASFVNNKSQSDLVSFDKTDSISMEDFQIAKAQEIDLLQRQNNINLTDKNIAELNLDNSILWRLINESMINYLANNYDFDISDDFVIKLVKNLPFFKNKDGEFDINIFKNIFHNSRNKENEYIKSYKKQLITNTLLDIFVGSFVPPKIMTENIINYMAETRNVDLLSVDLFFKSNNYKPKKIEPKQLKEFYENNQALFIIPELRNFSYIKADRKFILKKLKISESALKQFFEEHKNEFTEKTYSKAKKQVKESLISEKLEELTTELARNFEEDVSSGLTLEEISQKYKLKIQSVKDASLSNMNTSSVTEHIELADSVFEMIEDEISYPIEIADKNEIYLINLEKITSSRQQVFAEVEEDIRKLLNKRMLVDFNVQQLKEVQQNYNSKKVDKKSLKKKGISILANKSFTRSELSHQKKLPEELLNLIFITNKNECTNLVGDKNKAYTAYIKNITSNKSKAKTIMKDSKNHYLNVIRESLVKELMLYLTKQNNMQIKNGFLN